MDISNLKESILSKSELDYKDYENGLWLMSGDCIEMDENYYNIGKERLLKAVDDKSKS